MKCFSVKIIPVALILGFEEAFFFIVPFGRPLPRLAGAAPSSSASFVSWKEKFLKINYIYTSCFKEHFWNNCFQLSVLFNRIEYILLPSLSVFWYLQLSLSLLLCQHWIYVHALREMQLYRLTCLIS